MSLQHIQKNSPGLLPKPAKFEKNPPNGYRVIRKTKCGAGGAGGARSSPIHKQASLAGRLIILRILGTNHFLKKNKVTNNDLCRICGQQAEILVHQLHLFSECEKVCDLWYSIKAWIRSKIKVNIILTKKILVFGYTEADANSCPLNFILMIVRYYIFKCAMKGSNLNVYQVQVIAKEKFIKQELLSKINNKSDFKKKWTLWKDLFFRNLKKQL